MLPFRWDISDLNRSGPSVGDWRDVPQVVLGSLQILDFPAKIHNNWYAAEDLHSGWICFAKLPECTPLCSD